MTDREHTFVIAIVCQDAVGIVHRVSQAISDLDGDIADLRQSVLRGYLTMILVAAFPSQVDEQDLREHLAAIAFPGLPWADFVVRPADPDVLAQPDPDLENAYVLTARGDDRVGFVATVTSFCARQQINILDLSTAVDAGQYTMMLLVDLSRCPDVGAVRQALKQFASEQDLKIVLQHNDIFKVTHEVVM